MRQMQGYMAVLLAATLIVTGMPSRAAAAEQATILSEKIRSKVEQLGEGADIRLMLKDGRSIRGVIAAMEGSGVRIEPTATTNWGTIQYANVLAVAAAERKYRAKGSPDPIAVRRAAIELSGERRVQIKTTDGKSLQGSIIQVSPDQLTLRDNSGAVTNVAYTETQELKPGKMASGYKILAVAVVTLIGLIAMGIAVGSNH